MADPRADYLAKRAAAFGANPLDVATLMQYESGLNPSRWGGTGNQYYGLIQFGPNERKQFGIDTASPSFEKQVDASLNFLHSRGWRPEMGFNEMYSTILAGSPGHLNRSDGNGTVSQHLASKRMQDSRALAAKFLGGDYSPQAPQTASAPAAGLLGSASTDTPSPSDAQQLTALIQSFSAPDSAPLQLSIPAAETYDAAPMVQHLRPVMQRPKPRQLTGLL